MTKFVAALLVFVLLVLVRMPVRLLVVVLESAMARVDRAVTSAVSHTETQTASGVGEGNR
ncbi:MAG: hypothetical protein WBA97_24730 [Actinophytocola sp.]|uniref:hypothetical protein n=1 Tax=Actinophytocola sp. TaxID=1872138 RepID=UPI003C7295A0